MLLPRTVPGAGLEDSPCPGLPRDATPLDFAYRIHTDLGHQCAGKPGGGSNPRVVAILGHQATLHQVHLAVDFEQSFLDRSKLRIFGPEFWPKAIFTVAWGYALVVLHKSRCHSDLGAEEFDGHDAGGDRGVRCPREEAHHTDGGEEGRLVDLAERDYSQFDVMLDARQIMSDYVDLRVAVQEDLLAEPGVPQPRDDGAQLSDEHVLRDDDRPRHAEVVEGVRSVPHRLGHRAARLERDLLRHARDQEGVFAERLGLFASQVCRGPIERIEIVQQGRVRQARTTTPLGKATSLRWSTDSASSAR